MMEGKRVILSSTATFPEELVKDALIFELGRHTKLNRIIERIQKEFELNVIRRIIISGSGDESRKCVSCVEALKKALSNQNLYQWNLLRVKDNVNLLGAALSFKPEISIMVSRDPFPETYQSHSQQASNDSLALFEQQGSTQEVQTKRHAKPLVSRMVNNKWRRPDKKKSQSKRKT